MWPRFWSKILPAAFGALFLVCGPAQADIIVLVAGCSLKGTLSDRVAFASNPRAHDEVAILLEGNADAPPQLRRVPVSEIDFVVLESASGERRVFDLHASRAAAEPAKNSNPVQSAESAHQTQGGVGLLLGGGMLTALGATVNFSEPNHVSFGPSSDASGMHYDTANYVMMGIGGVMMLGGLMMLAGPRQPAQQALGVERDHGDTMLAYHHKF